MNYWCKSCWTPKLYGKTICLSCKYYYDLTDNFLANPITCKFGFKDCIHDPGYIYVEDPKWYKELYGDMSYEDAAKSSKNSCSMCSEECCRYDNEDK